jgi:O-antigen/teichoic acid export membrane protein
MFNIDNIISKYSKKLGLDLDYFLKNGFWTFFTLSITISLNLLLSYFIANKFSKETAGIWFFIIAISNLSLIFTFQGIDILGSNNFIKKKFKIYIEMMRYKLLVNILGIIILILTGFYFKYFENKNIWTYILIIIIYLITSNFSIYNKYLHIENKFKINTYLIIIKNIISIVGTIILINNNIKMILIISFYLLSQSIFDTILYFIIRKNIKINKNENISKKDIISSAIFSINEIIKQIAAQIDKFIIPFFINLEQLAIYAIAYTIPKTITNISNRILFNLLYKKINKYKIDTKLLTILICILTITIYILIPLIIKLMEIIFPLYSESIFYTIIILIFLPIIFINQILFKYFETNNLSKILFKISLIGNLSGIFLYFLLLPNFGILGMIISKVIRDIIILINLLIKIK